MVASAVSHLYKFLSATMIETSFFFLSLSFLPYCSSLAPLRFFIFGRLKAVLDCLPFPQMHVGGCRRGGWGWGWSTPFPDSDNCQHLLVRWRSHTFGVCLRVPVRVYIYMCICVSVCMYARARAYMCEYVCIRFLNPSGLISLECMRHVCANVIVCACAKLAFIAIVDVSSKISSAYRFDFRGHNASKLIVRFDFRFSLSLSLSLTYTHTHSLSLSLSLSLPFFSRWIEWKKENRLRIRHSKDSKPLSITSRSFFLQWCVVTHSF